MIDIGQDLDLYEDEAVEITKRVKELQEITLNETEFSREFNIPANNKNNLAFAFYANIDVDSTIDPHKSIEAMWTIDLAARFTGVLEIKGCTYKDGKPYSYILVFYGRVKNLGAKFGEDKLTDIDWTDYDHILSFLNVIDSWSGTLLAGDIMYPLVDYEKNYFFGPSSLNVDGNIANIQNGILLNDLKPAIRLRSMMQGIFANYGLTVSGTIDDDQFDNLYVQPNQNAGPIIDYESTSINAVYAKNSFAFSITSGGGQAAVIDDEIQDDGENYNPSTYTYTSPLTGAYNLNTTFQILPSSPPATISAQVSFRINGVDQITQSYGSGTVILDVLSVTDLNLLAGDTVQVFIKNTGATAITIEADRCTLSVVGISSGLIGQNMSLNLTMPDDKVVDYVNSVLKAFRWVVVPGTNVSEWQILSESDWRSQGVLRDWSDHIDLKNITYRKPVVYKNIRLTFAESESAVHTAFEEIANRRFGEVDIDTDIDFGEDQLLVESPFTLWPPSHLEVLNAENEDIGDNLMTLYKMLDIEGSKTKDKYLLFYNQGITFTTSYTYYLQNGFTGSAVNYAALTAYPLCAFYDNDVITDLPDNNDYSSTYSIEFPYYYESPPLDNFYIRYWQDELYNTYARGSRVATAVFSLPRAQFLTYELQDTIFCEGRNWTIDELSYNTGTQLAKATLRSENPIVDRAILTGVEFGGKANFTGTPDSFAITSQNMVKRGSEYFVATPKSGLLNNKLRYTEAKNQIFNTYITNIINTLNENILTWGES
jgi:hypothetical protein